MASTLMFPLKPSVIRMRLAGLAALIAMSSAGTLVMATSACADTGSTPKLSESDLKEARLLDWVPIEELTEEQKKRVPTACCGAYVAPQRQDPDALLPPDQASLRATAAETQTEQQTHVTMSGTVMITQGNRSVTSDTASVDQATREAELKGNIQLREPGFLFRADKAKMNMDSGEARLDNTKFVLYQTRVHGKADHLQKFGDNIINLERSEISSCEPGDNAWSIQGTSITLHPDEHYGTASNMRINIKDVPVIYMPYARFPIGDERLSGFLFPTVAYSKSDGLDVAVPFYWNIAPNYDVTITPRYIADRGSVLGLDARHMSENFDSEFSGSVLANDRGDNDATNDYRGDDRWFYKFTQEGGHGKDWSSQIIYADMSDNDYLRDLNNGSVDANRQAYIHQVAAFDYRTEHWLMGVKADEYRLLALNQLPYRELPRIHLDGTYRLGSVNDNDSTEIREDNWVVKLNHEYVSFIKNRYFNTLNNKVVYGDRFNTAYALTWDKNFTAGFFKPSIMLKSLSYQLDEDNLLATADSKPSFVVPQTSLDAGLYFDRNAHLLGGDYLQTLEPRMFYFYSAYKNQDSLYNLTNPNASSYINNYINFDTSELTFNYNQLFRTTRFSGGDRLDDANQVSLAISSAFVSQTTGVERLRVSLGEIFYANDRRVVIYDPKQVKNNDFIEANTRSSSALALQLSGQITQDLRVSSDVAYDQKNGRADNVSAGIHYMDDKYRLFNMTYRYTLRPVTTSPSQPTPLADQSLNQIDTSILWPLNNQWSVIARTQYDFHYGVELDTIAGFEYNDCCYRIRTIARHWLKYDYNSPDFLASATSNDYEQGISIELQLKGLGNLGQGISKLLEKAVAGFSDREKNLR